MDKNIKQLIDMQLTCLKTCNGIKQSRIDGIFKQYEDMEIYWHLVEYENELLDAENKTLLMNNLPGYEEEFQQIEKDLEKTGILTRG